jgi:oxygen-independent coproporphyrinogen-3 oxidase
MLTEPIFDPELLQRFDISAPRYTSYPTAPQFSSKYAADSYRAAAHASNEDPIPRPLSMYVHIPYCFSPCFYCGCNRIISLDPLKGGAYLKYLDTELRLQAELFDKDRILTQLHYGGGTPNFLSTEQLIELTANIGRYFELDGTAQREFSIELDPRTTEPGLIDGLHAAGFNRISLGVQDFNGEVQRAVNRIQSVEETLAIIQDAHRVGMRSVSVDLIYGLPRQTPAGFSATLDVVAEARPDRVAVYSYAHLPERFRAQRRIHAEDLPDAATKLQLLELCVTKLGAAGYHYIGMDHFALPDDELVRAQAEGKLQRNFQGYSTHADCDLIGLGMSSIGKIGDFHHQNERDLPAYVRALEQQRLPIARGIELDADDIIRRDAIQRLMCDCTLDIPAFEHRHSLIFHQYFGIEMLKLRELADAGLVELSAQRIAITRRGRLLMRIVAMVFDRYLRTPATVTQFSKVV